MSRIDSAAARVGLDRHRFIGLLSLLIVGVLLWATYAGLIRGLFEGGKPEVTAVFSNVATLKEGDLVRVQGVNVGTVKKIEKADGGRAAKVTMTVDKQAGTLYNDARAKVVWRTLLGGAFAINVEPGRSESGALDGRTIPLSQTTSQVELDDVTSVVEGEARQGLRDIPPELSAAMSNPSTLKDLALTLDRESPTLEKGLNAVRGTQKDSDLTTLLHETARTVRALDAPDDGVQKLVSGAGGTLQVTANREADLRATIARAPGTLQNADTTLARLDDTLDLADPLVRKLRSPAGQVAPTLRQLHPVVTSADTLLGRARPLLTNLRPAVSSLASAARRGTPLLEDLTPSINRLDGTVLPYFNEKDAQTGFTTAEMVGPALGGLANVAAPYDQNGHVLRFPFSDGSSPLYLPCQEYFGNPDKTKLVECRDLQQTLRDYLQWNPFAPAKGTAPTNGNPPSAAAIRKGR